MNKMAVTEQNMVLIFEKFGKQIDQKGMNYTLFKACGKFYKVYPQIGSTVSSEIKLPDFGKVRQCRTNLSQIQMF